MQYDIDAKTHAGVKNQFNLNFVKPGIISLEDGKLYSDLFDSRQKGDYGDLFDFDEDTVINLLSPVGEFITRLEELLKH